MHASTNLLREGFGSYGSRATVMGGSAVVDAAGNSWTLARGGRGAAWRGGGRYHCCGWRRAWRGQAAVLGGACSCGSHFGRRRVRELTADLQLWDGVRARRRRSGHRRGRAFRLRRGRRRRPHRQPVDAARAGDRRRGARLGSVFGEHLVYDEEGSCWSRRSPTIWCRSRPISRTCGRCRCRSIPRRTIRSASKGPGRAVSSRSAGRSPTRLRLRCVTSASSRAHCRFRRRRCGGS